MPLQIWKRKTAGGSAEINRPAASKADVSNYDGTANTSAGSVPPQTLEVEGAPTVIERS